MRRCWPGGGVELLRDGLGVAHVYGATRSDSLVGARYVTREEGCS